MQSKWTHLYERTNAPAISELHNLKNTQQLQREKRELRESMKFSRNHQYFYSGGTRRGNLTEGLYIGLDYEKVYFV
ncbi:hypothetical protein NBRC3279_1713 [Acetobacter pasteurianus NBRC 3279]|nr:hypothetical protein NBRC3279_1713 [Acetobacter pasteurianus NBRC 3279]GCD72530.1 hypothetical protein NBRC3284_1686 [Acetobacter pasteurianus NBRC 3284]